VAGVIICCLIAASMYILINHKRDVIFHGIFRVSPNIYSITIDDKNISVFTRKGRLLNKFEESGRERCIFSACSADLNKDGMDEILLLTGNTQEKYADTLVIKSIYHSKEGDSRGLLLKAEELQQFDFKSLNPWKVQTADVDGDGRLEISVGVYKTAKFHPVMAKRPFLYNWDQGGISPKWLGSRLSRPFDDYVFADIDGDGMEELLSIEILADGQKAVNSYKWKGFGFESIGESGAFTDISELRKGKGTDGKKVGISARVKREGAWKQLEVLYEGDKLVIE
jgi:hypothetical protein